MAMSSRYCPAEFDVALVVLCGETKEGQLLLVLHGALGEQISGH